MLSQNFITIRIGTVLFQMNRYPKALHVENVLFPKANLIFDHPNGVIVFGTPYFSLT